MLKKKLFWFIVFNLLLAQPALAGNSAHDHPALALMRPYAEEVREERAVIPYIVNIIAIYELNRQRHLREVKNYIEWYLSRLNYPDRQGLTCTIYDYEISLTGEEKSLDHYDSVDGYAGTFLYLLNLYHLHTQDNALIHENWEKIKGIAYLIPYLQQSDGLTVALAPDRDQTKYLMDNCEAYAGMLSFQKLARRSGKKDDSFYPDTAETIRKAVLKILYDRRKNNFSWAMDQGGKHASSWSNFYPDALAQIFPIYFGLLDHDRQKKIMLWRTFQLYYKNKVKDFAPEQRMIYEMTREKMRRQIP
jgi:hypothetical protein